MITASIVTYNNNLIEIEAILHSLLISPVRKVWIIDHSDTLTTLEGELAEYMKKNSEYRKFSELGYSIKYILHHNNGYGGGHNVALREAIEEGSQYHLVVNPDVWFGPEVIPTLWKLMEDDTTIAQVMPKVLYLNGHVQRVAKLLPTPMDLFGRFFLPKFLIQKRNNKYELRHSGYDKTLNVPYLSGCFMFFRTKAIQEIGLFDEHFFMYAEDADITRRLHREHKTLFYPEVAIYHKFNRASYRSLRMFWIHFFNMIKYFNKWGWLYDLERHRFNKQLLKEIQNASLSHNERNLS